MNVIDFARGTEKMVDPMAVGKTHYMQTKLRRMPVWLQKKIVTSAAKKADKMPFVVEPYAFFLFYEIMEPEKLQKYMPEGFRPAKAAAFSGDEMKYYGIVSMFRIHTSVFWGVRSEFYLVAENTKTGLLSWVMMDYFSDTISYDEKHGLKSPDAFRTVLTTTCEGKLIAEIKGEGKEVCCQANLKGAQMRALEPKFWIEGNTSIAYGRLAGEADGDLFSLTFMPEEMTEAWEVPIKEVSVERVKCGNVKIEAKLEKAICFPFAQHMLSDSPGVHTHYGNEKALRAAAEAVDFKQIRGIGARNRG